MKPTIHDALDALGRAEKGDVDALRTVRCVLEDICHLSKSGELPIRQYILEKFRQTLDLAGITSGTVLEIGGAKNTFLAQLGLDLEFLSVFPLSEEVPHRLADITNCPHIPDNSYDAVFSISVLEHVTRPWDAAKEISRILKPGGITFHVVPFSYFYHLAPIDYWRLSPAALKFLFQDCEPLVCEFYTDNRRRDNRGSEACPLDLGGPGFAVDALGGWRENVQTIFAGRKTEEACALRRERDRKQLIIDTVRAIRKHTKDDAKSVAQAPNVLSKISIDDEGKLVLGSFEPPSLDEIKAAWSDRDTTSPETYFNRNLVLAMTGYKPT